MKIINITSQKYRSEYLNLTLEDGQILKIHQSIAQNHNLDVNFEVSLDFLNQLRQEGELREALEYATLSLNLKDRSVEELTQKLRGRKFSQRIIHIVLEELKSRKLLNDASFTQNYIESKLSTRASERIKEELAEKGIPEAMVEEALKNVTETSPETPSEEERAFQILKKRAQQIKTVDKRALYRRLYDYLNRRGFDPDTIDNAFKRYKLEIGGGIHESTE